MDDVIWRPSLESIKKACMTDYLNTIKNNFDNSIHDYQSLHNWSVQNPDKFWKSLFSYFKIKYEGSLEKSFKKLEFFPYSWFPDIKLNFAENLLKDSDNKALSFIHESEMQKSFTHKELSIEVSKLQFFLKSIDFKTNDVFACYMPNISETVISMLAASSLGGTFTSTSCDFGTRGVVDRFIQSRPKVLCMTTHYSYGSKVFDLTDRIEEICKEVPSIQKVILVDFLNKCEPEKKQKLLDKGYVFFEDLNETCELEFIKVPFSHPQYIMYSSGTTGKPKCIVHSVGGTLLQHLKELAFHSDLKKGEKICYFTTCGWMMWNWLVTAMSLEAEVVLYEGSPAFPSLEAFMEKVSDVHVWGTSPKFLKALEIHEWKKNLDFKNLRLILSTGAPLMNEQFDYVYKMFGDKILLASICGGTDIISCFMLGNPIVPLRRGRIQSIGLGMDVACFNDQSEQVFNIEGELVCKNPFVSQPIYFLNDIDNQKLKSSYFERYENTWHHGDFVEISKDLSVKVFGRSDATLNPGGVRIGTGEIYRQTEKINFLKDSICVARNNSDGDVDIILFVKMSEGESLSDQRIREIKKFIKANATPRHVPKEVLEVKDIPYTRSGKKVELAITRMLAGKEITNLAAIANPESLEGFKPHV